MDISKETIEKVLEDVVTDTPKTEEVVEDTKVVEPVVFEIADFRLKCSVCGEDSVYIPNVRGGLITRLFTTDQHNFVMECPKCKTKLEYYFATAAHPELEVKEEKPSDETSDAPQADVELSLDVEPPLETKTK